jgi:hypothetical protein
VEDEDEVPRGGRVMVNLPGDLGNLIRARAKASYRPIAMETVMLIELGLAAENAASAPSA